MIELTFRRMKMTEVQPLSGAKRPADDDDLPARYRSLGFWKDVRTGRWMLVPRESAELLHPAGACSEGMEASKLNHFRLNHLCLPPAATAMR